MVLATYMAYPFLRGGYDSLAVTLSTMIQIFGGFGLLFVPVGIGWLTHEGWKQRQRKQNLPYKDRSHLFALLSIIVFSVISAILSLVAFAMVGISFGSLTLALFIYVFFKLNSRLRQLKNTDSEDFAPLPFYLIFIPTFIVFFQFILGPSLTSFSRNHAIANSAEMISDIENYHEKYGHYPDSLQAVWKDYYPDVVGVEKFHYAPHGDAYDLFFEQPRFFFDNFGTREFVVYNKLDEHRMMSHTSWIMIFTPQEMQTTQGWYTVQDAPSPHWKYFWFD